METRTLPARGWGLWGQREDGCRAALLLMSGLLPLHCSKPTSAKEDGSWGPLPWVLSTVLDTHLGPLGAHLSSPGLPGL